MTLDDLIRGLSTPSPMLQPYDDNAKVAFSGYYILEEMERRATRDAITRHKDWVAVWYRALTLYRLGLAGEWNADHLVAQDHDSGSLVLQSQLVGLGLNSVKSSLDLLLAGYYSPAFAVIRHMIETFVQCMYVDVFAEDTHIWYAQPGGIEMQLRTPGCKKMIDKLKSTELGAQVKKELDRVYEAWEHMSKGSHPTGEGIGQTVDEDGSGRFQYGATYQSDYIMAGFDHGFFAIEKLLLWLNRIRLQSPEWITELESLQHDIMVIVDQIHAKPAPD